MHLKTCLLSFLAVFFAAKVPAQSKLLKEADVLFYTKHYSDAYHLYEKAYEKKRDNGVLLKMAECNYNIENYPVAQGYYEKYFTDTFYHAMPEYLNYANASRLSGKIERAAQLYTRISRNGGDPATRGYADLYKLYLDSAGKVRAYDLDSVYTCVTLDATESLDLEAAPMIYIWKFKDGSVAEGLTVNHCFKSAGFNEVVLNIRDKATGYLRVNDTTLSIFIESPKVKFSSPKRAKQYFYTTFDASALVIDDYDILEYFWEVGAGEKRLGKKVQMKYDKLEEHRIKLTVIAKSKITGKNELFAACRWMEVVDNYDDHSKSFKDNLNDKK